MPVSADQSSKLEWLVKGKWNQLQHLEMQNAHCDAEGNPLIHEYTLDNRQLVRVSAEKDLRVTITGTLSWHSHIHTAKANKLLGF